MSKVTVFDLQKNVNPHFRIVWENDKPNNVLKGGRNSFKSSVIVLKLVEMMMMAISRGDKVEIVVVRKVANTIRDSVYAKIWWALNKVGVASQFEGRVSPYKIFHKKNKSAFHFYGQDDFQKLKSNEVGGVVAVWYEESAEFDSSEEFDQSNSTFMRQKHPNYPYVKFFWSYNPPRNPYSWINEWVETLMEEEDYLVHSSSYLDDELGFVTKQMLKEIERIKKNDIEYFRYLYLGEPVGLGTNVYNYRLFKQVDKIPDDERIIYIYFGVDSGHQQSATTCISLALTNKKNLYVLDNYYYSPARKSVKKAPTDLCKDINDFIKEQIKTVSMYHRGAVVVRKRTIDSAEGALRNEYYKKYGVRWNPVAKKKKIIMAGYVQSLLAEGRIKVLKTPNNVKYFLDEHKKYRWNEKTLKSPNPEVIKEDDHTCDAFQYLIMDNLVDFGLKV